MRKYSEINKRSARAQQAWVILTGLARDHRTIWYSHLGRLMQSSVKHGMSGPLLAGPLGDILYFCQYNQLPPLTSIVVEQKSGLPSGGFPMAPDQIPAVQQVVFAYDWADIAVPREEEFEAARNAMTQGSNRQPSELAASPATD
jgi:hypothetical protein